jgi:hypothetical protein
MTNDERSGEDVVDCGLLLVGGYITVALEA